MEASSEIPGIVAETEEDILLVDKIWENLEKSENREGIDASRKEHQRKILDSLPKDIEKEMEALASYVNTLREPQNSKHASFIAGELFENFIRSDSTVCPHSETSLALEIRSFLKNPRIYNLPNIDYSISNPDIAIINEKGELISAVEVKSGKIDKRGIGQLRNFKNNLITALEIFKRNPTDILKSHGLRLVAENIGNLKVAEKFFTILAVPYGAYENPKGLIKSEDFNPQELQSAETTMRKSSIYESPFSRNDLKIATDTVIEWLKSKKIIESPADISAQP